MLTTDASPNFELFRDCLSTAVISKLAAPAKSKKQRPAKGRKKDGHRSHDSPDNEATGGESDGDLEDFIEYLSEEMFKELPPELRTISYAAIQDNATLAETYAVPLDSRLISQIAETLPPSISDSLCTYGMMNDATDLDRFLDPVLSAYVSTATAAPPEYTPAVTASKPPGCEICGREQLPLTYHHLIPRQVHAKAVKRGWHKEWELNKVAWLCRACHSCVHHVASNEELARDYYDLEKLLAREDVQRFAQWVGRVRWKAR